LDQTVAYAREHYRFRSPNERYQAIQHALVEMATELEAARRLAYHAAALASAGVGTLRLLDEPLRAYDSRTVAVDGKLVAGTTR
jgi:alkylation response protein AidB-like acyl-CoA dehydrogenase